MNPYLCGATRRDAQTFFYLYLQSCHAQYRIPFAFLNRIVPDKRARPIHNRNNLPHHYRLSRMSKKRSRQEQDMTHPEGHDAPATERPTTPPGGKGKRDVPGSCGVYRPPSIHTTCLNNGLWPVVVSHHVFRPKPGGVLSQTAMGRQRSPRNNLA